MTRTRHTPDGPDYQVVCHAHEWASPWLPTVPVGCPSCVVDTAAHQRYLEAHTELLAAWRDQDLPRLTEWGIRPLKASDDDEGGKDHDL